MINRRRFLRDAASTLALSGAAAHSLSAATHAHADSQAAQKPAASHAAAHKTPAANSIKHPRAITMWEFSWIERRWPGAGYEDWDQALDGLVLRGYNAVRIDPFPHLLAVDPHRTWQLLPEWNTQEWGSPDVNRIVLVPALFEFLRKCRDRKIMVGLSTWYREDTSNARMAITGPDVMAANWIKTLQLIQQAGLLDTILYTDLCNEWPGIDWAPFVKPPMNYGDFLKPASLSYMKIAVELVRAQFPQMPLFFDCAAEFPEDYLKSDLSYFDLLDPHIWMAQQNQGEFYLLSNYHYERFESAGYTNLSLKAEDLYNSRKSYWQSLLVRLHRSPRRHLPLREIAADHHRVLGRRRLQGLAAAAMGLGERIVRAGSHPRRLHRTVAGHRHFQFLRPPIRRHVARRRLAPKTNRHHPLLRNRSPVTPRPPLRKAMNASYFASTLIAVCYSLRLGASGED